MKTIWCSVLSLVIVTSVLPQHVAAHQGAYRELSVPRYAVVAIPGFTDADRHVDGKRLTRSVKPSRYPGTAVQDTAVSSTDSISIRIRGEFQELRQDILNDKSIQIDWWMQLIAVLLGVGGVVIAALGSLSFIGVRAKSREVKELQKQIGATAKEIERMAADTEDAKRSILNAATEVASAKKEAEAAATEVANAKAEVQGAATEVTNAMAEVEASAREVTGARAQVEASSKEVANAKAEAEAAAAKVANAKHQAETAAERAHQEMENASDAARDAQRLLTRIGEVARVLLQATGQGTDVLQGIGEEDKS